ncbi:hypothetical protein V3C99_000528 [Haemonchus contortus]
MRTMPLTAMWDRSSILLLVVLLANPVLPRRASGGGGFSSRGGSAARGSVGQPGGFNPSAGGGFHPQPNQGGFHPNQGGFQPNQGGFRPQPNAGGFHPQGGFQGGFHPNQGGFRPGSGLGSSSSSSAFKTALVGGALGAVGGIVAYEAGKAIIKSATQPFNHNGNNYYWDNNYQQKPNEIMCSMPLSQLQQLNPTTTTTTTTGAPVTDADGSTTTAATTTMNPNQVLNNLQFADGSRPKTISWGCKRGVEVCCGTDCCPAPVSNNNAAPGAGGSVGGGGAAGVAIGILILVLLSCCCCVFIAYKCCRSAFDGCLPQSDHKQHEGYPGDYNQQYPMQQYPSQSYPQSQGYPPSQGGYPQHGGYPPQQGYPQAYPPHPTY